MPISVTGGPPWPGHEPEPDGNGSKGDSREPMDWHDWMADMRQRVRSNIRLATAAVPDSLPDDDDAGDDAELPLPVNKDDWCFTEAESAAIYAMRQRRDEMLMIEGGLKPGYIAFMRYLLDNNLSGEWE